MNIYFYRPHAELDADLEKVYQKVTEDYNATIQAENEAIIGFIRLLSRLR